MQKKKSNKKTKKIIISLVLVVAIVAAVCWAVFKPEEKLKVETLKAEIMTISETLDTSGTVSAVSQDNFSLPTGVIVETLNVKQGDEVKKGDIIATFDLTSLDEALSESKNSYDKAEEAYNTALKTSEDAKVKVDEVKNQIEELESEIERLSNLTQETDTTSSSTQTVDNESVQNFIRIAKLFGQEYSEEEAIAFLSGILGAGSNMTDLNTFIENLDLIAGTGNSFDFSALSGMTSSSELMSAEMSLIQLKAQLATLELQADDTYVATFKTIFDSAEESYLTAKAQIDSMRTGWIAREDGIVTEVNVSADGTFVGNNTTASVDITSLLSLASSGTDITSLITSLLGQGQAAVTVLYYPLVADISLSKYDILEVDLEQEVIVKPASGNELSGKVSYISAVATSSNGLNISSIMGSGSSSSVIPAQVTIENVDESVIVGIDVQVSIITDTVENAVVVPVEVICIDGEDIFVYVLEDGKAVKRNVELGIASDTHYQVLSGISQDDVLIKNTSGLEEGVSVETN